MVNVRVNVRCVCLAVVFLVGVHSAPHARGNPAPEPGSEYEYPPILSAPLVIKVSQDQLQSRIVIPRSLLALAARTTGPKVAKRSESQTVVAGIALSLVVAVGGIAVAFIRRRKVRASATVAIAVLAAGLCLIGTAVADLSPGGSGDTQGLALAPEIVIEATDLGNSVVLVIGKESAAEMGLR